MPILKYRANKNAPWNSIAAIKGDAFKFEDFTPEQLESLRGPQGAPFAYEDFTPEQLESLRGPAGVDGTVSFDSLTEAQRASLKGEQGDVGPVGPEGPVGPQGPKGADGTMTFSDLTDEQKQSLKGDSGVSATHSWNGTILTITSASGTSSANLIGPAGPAYTLTNTDKQNIADLVLAQLPMCEEVSY